MFKLSEEKNRDIEPIDTKALEQSVHILKAIGHPVRLAILKMLNVQFSLPVQEISEALDLEQSLTSHHLAIMRKNGILSNIRKGQKILYYIRFPEVVDLVTCVENYGGKLIEAMKDADTKEQKEEN